MAIWPFTYMIFSAFLGQCVLGGVSLLSTSWTISVYNTRDLHKQFEMMRRRAGRPEDLSHSVPLF